jgi:hypothetical protein
MLWHLDSAHFKDIPSLSSSFRTRQIVTYMPFISDAVWHRSGFHNAVEGNLLEDLSFSGMLCKPGLFSEKRSQFDI